VVVLGILLVTSHSGQVRGSPTVGLSIALSVMLVAEIGALARAEPQQHRLLTKKPGSGIIDA
jgi:hypothetical protein